MSNIELLRIISIIFIVISHYTVHGGVDKSALAFGINRFILEISTLGNIATLIFLLISGYFLIESSIFKLNKLIRLYFQVLFYSLVIYLGLVAFKLIPFSLLELLKNIFPIIFKQYWFVTGYVVIYLFYPFINTLLNSLNKQRHFFFILLLTTLFFIIPTITLSNLFGNELLQFLTAYTIGAYLKKYPDSLFSKHDKKIYVASAIFISLSVAVLDYVDIKFGFFKGNSIYFLDRTSIASLIHAISLFSIFTKMKIQSAIINKISSNMFGVYLISDNNYLRPIIWHDIFKNASYATSSTLLWHMFISVSIIIVSCLIIDFLRKKILEEQVLKKLIREN